MATASPDRGARPRRVLGLEHEGEHGLYRGEQIRQLEHIHCPLPLKQCDADPWCTSARGVR